MKQLRILFLIGIIVLLGGILIPTLNTYSADYIELQNKIRQNQ